VVISCIFIFIIISYFNLEFLYQEKSGNPASQHVCNECEAAACRTFFAAKAFSPSQKNYLQKAFPLYKQQIVSGKNARWRI
jgi:hypothetical protein